MLVDDLEPRPQRGAALNQLVREDLDPYAVEELADRIAVLEGEIERVRAAVARKNARRSDADALFKFDS